MANFKVDFPNDLTQELIKISNTDEYMLDIIDKAMPTVVDSLKAHIRARVKDGTGTLVGSVKSTRASKPKNGGYYAIARPVGKDKKGVRNMEKLAYLEYGTTKQTPRPLLASTKGDVLPKVEEIVRQAFKDSIDG